MMIGHGLSTSLIRSPAPGGIPLVISPNSILAIRADMGITVAGADVTAVADQSGEAHDYGNAGSGTYVQYDDTTWGLPVLTAPDTSRRLVGHADVATALLGDDNAYTIYGLVYRPSTANGVYLWGVGDAVSTGDFLYITTQTSERLSIAARDGTNVAIVNSTVGSFGVGWHAFAARCNGTTLDIFIDSASVDTAAGAFDVGDKSGPSPIHALFARPPSTGGASSIHEWEVCTGAAHIDDITAKMASMLASKAALEAA